MQSGSKPSASAMPTPPNRSAPTAGSIDHMIRLPGRKCNCEAPSGPANSLMTAMRRYGTVPDYLKCTFENRVEGIYHRKYVSEKSLLHKAVKSMYRYKKKMR